MRAARNENALNRAFFFGDDLGLQVAIVIYPVLASSRAG